jgi:uncharacterized protein with GYD domain
MMDENDDGARVGLWVVIGIITLLLFGLIGGLGIRALNKKPAVAAAPADMLVDMPLTGVLVVKMYFEVGKAELPADALMALAPALKALADNPGKKLVLAGFHDTSGTAALNAELAKNRAKAVRAALSSQGVDILRLMLRKPEHAALEGPAEEARRVEIRLVD